MGYKQAFGKWGEITAAAFLENKGMEIIDRNWRCLYGEIDFVAMFHDEVVFVEVKARRNDNYGLPEKAITPKKKIHLIHSAAEYIEKHQINNDWRIDIISIRRLNGKNLEVEWFENAVRENE